MMQISQTGKQSGFTLLELLLAVTLGAVVLSAVYGSYSTAIDAHQRISRSATELQAWRFFSERLRADLTNLVTDEKGQSNSLTGDSEKLTLQYAPHEGTPETILYEQRSGADGAQVRRTALRKTTDDEGVIDVNEAGTVVFDKTEKVTFRYLTNGQWNSETGQTLPSAVECEVVADGRARAVVINLEAEHLES